MATPPPFQPPLPTGPPPPFSHPVYESNAHNYSNRNNQQMFGHYRQYHQRRNNIGTKKRMITHTPCYFRDSFLEDPWQRLEETLRRSQLSHKEVSAASSCGVYFRPSFLEDPWKKLLDKYSASTISMKT